MPEKQPTVALAEKVDPAAFETFEAAGHRPVSFPDDIQDKNLSKMLKAEGAQFLGIRSTTEATDSTIRENPQLDAIGRFGVGTDGIALATVNELGLAVFISPFGNRDSVAELTMGGIYAISRNLASYDSKMREGGYPKGSAGNYQIKDKTLGVLGWGIGSLTGRLAVGSRMKVVAYDPEIAIAESEEAQELDDIQEASSMEEVLYAADFLALHVPLVAATRGLIGEEQLAMMKSNAFLLNLSRGEIIDINALARAVDRKNGGHLGGAFLDVFNKPTEKEMAKGDYSNVPTIGLDNVVHHPHNAGNTEDAQASMGEEVANKYIAFKKTGNTHDAINLPTTDILEEPKPGSTRIFYAHTNEPNAVRDAADIIGDANLNLGPGSRIAQPEDDSLGQPSVINFDVIEGEVTPEIMQKLRAISHARRVWATPPIG